MLNKSGDNVHHCLVPSFTGQSPGTPEPWSLQLQRSLGATTVEQLKINILKSGNND